LFSVRRGKESVRNVGNKEREKKKDERKKMREREMRERERAYLCV